MRRLNQSPETGGRDSPSGILHRFIPPDTVSIPLPDPSGVSSLYHLIGVVPLHSVSGLHTPSQTSTSGPGRTR